MSPDEADEAAGTEDGDESAGTGDVDHAAESEEGDEATSIDLFSPAEDRLLLDAMLGKLATYLRMCGYDTAYVKSDASPAEIGSGGAESATTRGGDGGEPSDPVGDGDRETAIRELATAESRTLVTRDRALGTRTPGAILLSGRQVEDQLAELARAGFALRLSDHPERCATCNAGLEAVGAEEPTPDYAPDAATTDVWRCPACGQHYWQGSHWDDVAETLAGVR
jgi:uncharacterized protein with PIN domain